MKPTKSFLVEVACLDASLEGLVVDPVNL